MKKLFLLAALAAAVFADGETLREAIAPFAESGALPGAVMVLEKPGATDIAEFGFVDEAGTRRISLDSTFMQCSQTKGFCGVTVAILVEEGKLSLDDPVSKYLPQFKTLWVKHIDHREDGDIVTLREAKNVLTVRDAMNHTGGFPFEIPSKQQYPAGLGWRGVPLDVTALEAAAMPLLFEPGTKVQYSNTGIDVGARIVEAVTGKPWPEFLKERVLDPLGMKDTTFQPTEEMLSRAIPLWHLSPREGASHRMAFHPWMPAPHNGPKVFPSAGAGLWTTARDQLKFYRMLMNLGVGDNGARILKEETVKRLLATDLRFDGSGYSLGLVVTKDGWVGHGGAFGTNCMVNPEKKFLNLCVVQLDGGPRPWEGARDRFAERFFAGEIDAAAAAEYTGRTE